MVDRLSTKAEVEGGTRHNRYSLRPRHLGGTPQQLNATAEVRKLVEKATQTGEHHTELLQTPRRNPHDQHQRLPPTVATEASRRYTSW
jgi:hypothetical protein